MNKTDEYFKYEVKNVEKVNDTAFKIDAESELFVTLDNEWHVSFGYQVKYALMDKSSFSPFTDVGSSLPQSRWK